ncbi:hypothetical protein GGX14DRAFT_553966 [Mycena pura]|uniref:Uncharacterized protein n=1 Tax=Mycena pura TaxID=153505 RepID=A0AAD6YVC7_9AGAR|nr:hypothetical protein GGX14DRAFT_553966 [Mycena pura]
MCYDRILPCGTVHASPSPHSVHAFVADHTTTREQPHGADVLREQVHGHGVGGALQGCASLYIALDCGKGNKDTLSTRRPGAHRAALSCCVATREFPRPQCAEVKHHRRSHRPAHRHSVRRMRRTMTHPTPRKTSAFKRLASVSASRSAKLPRSDMRLDFWDCCAWSESAAAIASAPPPSCSVLCLRRMRAAATFPSSRLSRCPCRMCSRYVMQRLWRLFVWLRYHCNYASFCRPHSLPIPIQVHSPFPNDTAIEHHASASSSCFSEPTKGLPGPPHYMQRRCRLITLTLPHPGTMPCTLARRGYDALGAQHNRSAHHCHASTHAGYACTTRSSLAGVSAQLRSPVAVLTTPRPRSRCAKISTADGSHLFPRHLCASMYLCCTALERPRPHADQGVIERLWLQSTLRLGGQRNSSRALRNCAERANGWSRNEERLTGLHLVLLVTESSNIEMTSSSFDFEDIVLDCEKGNEGTLPCLHRAESHRSRRRRAARGNTACALRRRQRVRIPSFGIVIALRLHPGVTRKEPRSGERLAGLHPVPLLKTPALSLPHPRMRAETTTLSAYQVSHDFLRASVSARQHTRALPHLSDHVRRLRSGRAPPFKLAAPSSVAWNPQAEYHERKAREAHVVHTIVETTIKVFDEAHNPCHFNASLDREFTPRLRLLASMQASPCQWSHFTETSDDQYLVKIDHSLQVHPIRNCLASRSGNLKQKLARQSFSLHSIDNLEVGGVAESNGNRM